MRKFWIGLTLSGLMVASAAAGAWAASGTRKQIEVEYRNIQIAVDGKVVNTGTDEPFIYNDRTYIPARYVAEALGAKVGWDQDTATVQINTPNSLKVTTDGEYQIWSMPGQGFSIRVPRGFVRQEMPTALLQLVLPDSTSGMSSVVAVTKFDNDGSALKDQMNAIMTGLSQTFLPDAKVTNTTEADKSLTVQGTTTLFGKLPANFTIRLVQADKNVWMVLTLVPGNLSDQMAPVVTDILNSFTLQ